jgi:chemotaxis response regulator CheB
MDSHGVQVIALVASAGGLEALTSVLRDLPIDFPAAVVVAQHLSPQRSQLVSILRRTIPLPVVWAEDGSALAPGRVTFAPPRSLLEVLRDGTCVVHTAEGSVTRRPLDVLLASIAASFGTRSVGVVLTGMGNDGAAGTAALKAVGASVIAQDETTAAQPGMPRASAEAGADLIVPLHEIAAVLTAVVDGGP